ncbi:MAG: helix-turn-helix transcriptional regulator [Lentisphaerae bacterium]|nr:helix-turn-helix transcriptional regulator [Lentisphaerota bacterium]
MYQRLRIEVHSCHWWRVKAGWELMPRRITDDYFCLPMTHHLDAEVGDEHSTLLTGQCMLAREGEIHSSRMPTNCAEMHLFALHAHLLPQWGGTIAQLLPGPFHDLPDFSASQSRLQRVTHLLQTDAPLGRRMADHMLRDWIAFWVLQEHRFGEPEGRSDPRVAEAFAFIQEHYHEPITVEQLSDAVRLSPAHFRKLFRQAHGIAPKAYIANYRLKQAAQQLRVGTASVKEIAYDVGFADEHYFHLCFRKQFGCTPLAFRKRSREMI